MKRAFIIHGWGGYPEEGWFPWLKNELEDRGFEISVPQMPNADNPVIEKWVRYLAKIIKEPDDNTILIGHSVGCQTILRYLETLPKSVKVDKIILVAPWMKLDSKTIEEEGQEVTEIARPWMETPIDFELIKNKADKIAAVFSDNDPYVSIEDNRETFENKLSSEIIIEHNKGHFSGSDGITELPSVLEAIIK